MITYEPIGYLKCSEQYRFEAPRQGVLADNSGVIELIKGLHYEQALKDLNSFDYIWVIYDLHLNTNWKPMVDTPRKPDDNRGKKGLFATRSPHRPNSIGMSCVKLIKTEGNKIFIANFDMLNKSPILDIKPYITYCDSFPNASTGWLPNNDFEDIFQITFSQIAETQTDFINNHTSLNIKNFIKIQLSTTPVDSDRKRIKAIDKGKNIYELAYRTWRVLYKIENRILTIGKDNEIDKKQKLKIIKITSGYSDSELLDIGDDKYNDKAIHRDFNRIYR